MAAAQVEQRSRGDILRRMSLDEMRNEVQAMWDTQLRRAQQQSQHSRDGANAATRANALIKLITRNQSKLPTMSRAELADLLRDFDPKRQLSRCSIRFPAPPEEGTTPNALKSLANISGRMVSSSVRYPPTYMGY